MDNALDHGIKEADFWTMTLAEIERAINSRKRVIAEERKEKAIFDYTLANLIGRSVARIHSASATMPAISEAYPDIFNGKEEEEQRQERKTELSVLRFKQFAENHNKKTRGCKMQNE